MRLSLPSILVAFLLGVFLPGFASVALGANFEFQDGDRVVLVGDTLIEREQLYGYIEQRLTVEFPNRNVTFRNLGWSADTPAGESRASFDFDKPGKGLQKLKDQLAAIRPTVVILGYGMASSLAGSTNSQPRSSEFQGGVAHFKADVMRLIDDIVLLRTNQPVRFILLGPIRHEDPGAPLPNPAPHNQQLALYTKVLREIAAERKCQVISLYDLLGDGTKANPPRPLTDNGIHLTGYGYLRASEAVAQGLGWKSKTSHVSIRSSSLSSSGGEGRADGTRMIGLTGTTDHLQFTLLDDRLAIPVLRDKQGKLLPAATPLPSLQIDGLKPGVYELKVDGTVVVAATDKQWRRGLVIDRGPPFEQSELLRQAILKKNELYFNRWRPQNETYLFGFRKHEQGQNAKEIPMFDPLIEQQEAEIAKLRQPKQHLFELLPTTLATADEPRGFGVRPRYIGGAFARSGTSSDVQKVPERKRQGTAALQDPPDVSGFEVAAGFQVNLFAESPLLAKPIQMNFDPQGRLWIASSSVYPQIQPGQVADDKILVLEDTDGDGFAEKSTVFADGLLIPTGVEPGDGGAYVGQSTELLFLKDTDGDGKADEKRVVLSGFGTEDTHHIVHTLHWGHDGQLYFNQSIYIHSHIETPNGVERLNSGGLWHLRPPAMKLGVFLRGFCNPWGHQFDEFGQSFVTDGAGFQGISFGIPGATYFTYADMRRELKSISPGNYPKFCGLEIIRSAHFPPDWQGNAITCDFRAHRVARFGIEEQGSAYATRELPDLLTTTNVTFRPIDVKLGPDGALYIADWSNPIIQHGEVDFRDPRRDHEHGRIWRVSAKGRPVLERPNLIKASNQELLGQLLSPNAYNQQQARRVLLERGRAVQSDLARWTKSQTTDKALLEALWMYQALDIVQPSLLDKVLNAKDGRIRAAATRVVGYWHPRLKNPVDLLARRINDEHPRVRLEAMRALAQIPSARSAELVLNAVDKPMDSFLDYGAWLSINDLAQPWVASVKAAKWKLEGHEKQLEFALKAIKPELASAVLSQVLPAKAIARDGSGPWIELIGTAGDEALLRRLFDETLRGGFENSPAVRALQALSEASRKREAKPSGNLEEISSLLSHSEEKIREQALRLAGNWKLRKFVPQLLAEAGGGQSGTTRKAAFEALREIGGRQVISGLVLLTAKGKETAVRQQAVLTLAALDLEKASRPAAEVLMELTEEKEANEFWRSMLSVKGAGEKLAHALPKTGLPPAMAKAGLRVAREGGRNEPDLVWALTRGADLEGETQSLSAAEIQQLAIRVVAEGDAARGERIFRRKELNCFTCHAIGGVGGKVGPDLTSIGASAQVDYLIESILYPNRKIKEGYHSVIVETKDGLEFSGVLVKENADELVLRDATDKETIIAKNNIQNRSTGNSLMPSGLVDLLTPAERLDLFRFLSELGKPGPYDAAKGNVARSWKLFPQTLEVAQFGDEKVLETKLNDSQWKPARSLVDGRVLKEELAASLEGFERRDPRAVFAAAKFEVAKAGPISLKFTGADGSAAWVDGKSAGACGDLKPELPVGTHFIVVKLEAKKLPDAIRLESPDATFVATW